MPNTRRSPRPRKDHPFRPRVTAEEGDAFWLRQSLRCREELVRIGVTFGLQTALLVAFLLFGHTAWRLFRTSGANLPPWLGPGILGATALAVLLSVRRLVVLARQWRETRRDLREYRRRLEGG